MGISLYLRELLERVRVARCRCQILVCRFVHKAMHNFEEHDQLFLGSSSLQVFPLQVVQHRGHDTCVML